jgi:hypothetical protein
MKLLNLKYLDDHSLSYYDIFDSKFIRPNEGKYNVYVGFNAKDYNLLQTEIDAQYKLKFITWEEAHSKAKEKLNEFTVDEKLNILFGIQNMQKKNRRWWLCRCNRTNRK